VISEISDDTLFHTTRDEGLTSIIDYAKVFDAAKTNGNGGFSMRKVKQALGITVVGFGVAMGVVSVAPEAHADGGTYWASYPTYEECHEAAVEGRRAGEWYRYVCRDVDDHWDLWVK